MDGQAQGAANQPGRGTYNEGVNGRSHEGVAIEQFLYGGNQAGVGMNGHQPDGHARQLTEEDNACLVRLAGLLFDGFVDQQANGLAHEPGHQAHDGGDDASPYPGV